MGHAYTVCRSKVKMAKLREKCERERERITNNPWTASISSLKVKHNEWLNEKWSQKLQKANFIINKKNIEENNDDRNIPS